MESFQQSLELLKQHFSGRMAAFQHDLDRANATSAPATLSALTSEFSSFKFIMMETLCNLQQQVVLIARQQDQLEMRTRRKMLLLHGVPEGSGDNSSGDVVGIVSEKLKLPISTDSFSRCHRMGHAAGGKPRPILIKFRSVEVRDKIWFTKTLLKSSGFTLSEFLTKERHDAFMLARKHFGVSKCWTRNGYVIIEGSDGERHRVASAAEVNGVIKALPVAASCSTVPSTACASVTLKPAETAGGIRSKRSTKNK
ncbi:uncharacterized protein ACR2FA_002689 [Aphomia sociella]